MKLTLIHPPQFVAFGNQVSTIAMPPIGLAYLAGSLLNAGHDVRLIDGVGEGLEHFEPHGSVYLRGLPHDEIVSRIPKDTELIGVGCMFSSQWLTVRQLLKQIKAAFPGVPLILGGEHATGLPEMSFAQSPIDLLAQGEGEETLLELVRKLEHGQPIAGMTGIAYRTNSACVNTAPLPAAVAAGRTILDGQAVVNPRRDRLRNIDDIPLPAWHLVNLEGYQTMNQPHGACQGRFMPMLATRGCPFKCTFCTSAQMWTQLWRPRDPKKVVDEMELYIKRYNAVDFQFEDLTAIVRKKWIIDFCREILDRKLQITFQLPSGTRSEAVDKEAAAWMKKAGCHEFAFAPESGDPETLEIIKKQVDLSQMFVSARESLDSGISVVCFFIVGFPHETWRHIFNTYKAIAKCAVIGIKAVSVNVFSPQPATQLFEELRLKNRVALDDEYLQSLFEFTGFGRKKKSFNHRFSDAGITAVSIGGLAIFFGLRFLMRPHLLVQTVWEIFTLKSSNRFGKAAKATAIEFVRATKARIQR